MSDPSIVDSDTGDIVVGEPLRSFALGIDWIDFGIKFLDGRLLETSVSLFLDNSLLSLL